MYNTELMTSEFERENHQINLPRTENPLFSELHADRDHFMIFRNIVNKQLRNQSAMPINLPRVESFQIAPFSIIQPTLIDFPVINYTEEIEKSLSRLLSSTGSQDTVDLDDDEKETIGRYTSTVKELKELFVISPSVYMHEHPYQNSGFIVKNRDRRGPDKTKSATVVLNNGHESETILAYQSVLTALVTQGRLDISTDEKFDKSLPIRKEVFMNIYHEMLGQKEPFVKREDIFDLNQQIDDIETDLYHPLKKGQGRPMNTLLVGAPGVGKSIVGRYFMTDKDILTIPLSVDKLDDFEYVTWPVVSRAKNMAQIPAVILVDDIESLLGGNFMIDEEGRMSQSVNPQDRSEALSLLERMQDTYGVYLLCSLNHPDVEAAFLRRFNPIYFPMPTEEQRKFMLEGIVPQETLSKEGFEELVSNLAQKTEGFNYHALAKITEYIENLRIKNGDSNETDHKEMIEAAFAKASRSVDRKALKRFDDAAKKMVGLE